MDAVPQSKRTLPVTTRKPGLFSFENEAFYNKKNFSILCLAVFLLMTGMSLKYGVNGDEKFQVDYSKKLWSYYTTMGKDTSALYVPDGNMHLYGGFFDLTAISINKLLGWEDEFVPAFHSTRRVLCAVFGFIAVFFASLFGKQIGGWPLAFITMLCLLLSPRFLGDAMVNPKDIPFAAGYIMTLYFISRFVRALPKPALRDMIGIIVGVLIALNTRSGGLLLIVYLFVFMAAYLMLNSIWDKPKGARSLAISVGYTLVVGFLAYCAGIVFWPFALSDPWVHPYQSLTEFTHQPISISILFNGIHRSSAAVPWNYLPEWIIRTVPLTVLFGLFFFLRLLKKRFRDVPLLEVSILVFSVFFPIGYAIYKHSALHDGWRHFLFIYPSLEVLAALGWYLWFISFHSKSFRVVSFLLLLGLWSENIYSIIVYHPYQYVYFNPLFGGIKKAYGYFETDYWMLSIREASEWLKKNEKSGMPLTVATNCMYPTQVFLTDASKHMDIKYMSYYDRSSKNWDYALFYSRFIHSDQLLNRSWPPKGTVHVIKANDVPLCAVVKRENREDYLGFEALQHNNILEAIKHFNAASIYAPQNETVSYALAEAYKNTCQYDLAEQAVQQSLSAYPNNPAAIQLMETIRYEREQFRK